MACEPPQGREEHRMRTRRGLALATAMLTMAVPLAACGGDDGGDSTSAAEAGSTTTQAGAPEDRIAPDAQVGAGLVKLKDVAEQIADAPDGDVAKEAAEGLEPVWEPIEGTVKKNEPDLYLDIEDSFQRLQSGDLENAKQGEQALATAVDAYLDKHPQGATDEAAEDEGSPESRIATDAEVTAGLMALKGVAATVAAAPDGDTAKQAAAGLEAVWEPVEGTVKKNEPDLYLDIEDSFQRMGSGDLANARKGRQALDSAVDAYLAKHPG
jgi:hypothetical protein